MNSTTDEVQRELGDLPLSVGTSLAFQSLMGTHPDNPRLPRQARQIEGIWINLRTLVRNVLDALTREQLDSLTSMTQPARWVVEELAQLGEVMAQLPTTPKWTVYVTRLDDLKWQYPAASFKTPNTRLQHLRQDRERIILDLVKEYEAQLPVPVMWIKRQPPVTQQRAALLTHHPHELLWRGQFQELMLLESYTGRLKLPKEWPSKLHTLKKDIGMPFNAITLQIFGDGSLFHQAPRAIRDDVIRVAQLRRWSPVTTEMKLWDDIQRHAERSTRDHIARLHPRTG